MQRVEQNSAKEKRFLVQAQPVPSTWSAAAQRRASNAPNILDVVALARAQAEPPTPVRARPTLADAAMGVRQAAVLIQRCYRGHRIRSRRRLQLSRIVRVQALIRGWRRRQLLEADLKRIAQTKQPPKRRVLFASATPAPDEKSLGHGKVAEAASAAKQRRGSIQTANMLEKLERDRNNALRLNSPPSFGEISVQGAAAMGLNLTKSAEQQLVENADRDTRNVPREYQDTVKLDCHRKELLRHARSYAPHDAIFKWRALRLLRYSIVPRLLTFRLVWLVYVTFAATATLARTGVWVPARLPAATDGFDASGASMMISFMIVFYVGYCYSRQERQYQACTEAFGSVTNACLLARASLTASDRLLVWRYLNLAHVAGYCGLTATYNKRNLFDYYCLVQNLWPSPEVRRRVALVDVDKGAQAYRECIAWALDVVTGARRRGEITAEEQRQASETMLTLQSSLTTLYNYQFQVMPFMYTQLVSFACAFYLIVYAILKGLHFTPDATVDYGFVFPFLALTLTTVTSLGLLEVGSIISNPCGDEAEDFAIYTFVDRTVKGSRKVIDAPVIGSSDHV